jgi:outer membrane immunogenic protein
MKKLMLGSAALVALLAAGSAMAADLSRPEPVYKAPPPPPIFSWTGFYIGGNLGGAWANTTITDSLYGLSFSNGSKAVFVGGGQVGFNYQFAGGFVIGVEGDFDWAVNNNNSVTGVVVPGGDSVTASANDKWMATVAGRFGYAYDRWLWYVKGGGGWVGANSFTVTDVTTGASFTAGNSNTVSGWLIGGGFEWAFANNWSVRVEYDYFGLSGRSFTVPAIAPVAIAGDTFTTGKNNIQMATVGINYLFGMH